MRESQPLREEMATLLKLDTMEKALAALESATRPTSIPPPIPNNHPDTAIAHEYYRMLGVQQTIETLRSMAVMPGQHDSEHPLAGEAFTHNLPEHLRTKPNKP